MQLLTESELQQELASRRGGYSESPRITYVDSGVLINACRGLIRLALKRQQYIAL
jgi:hypothetical protein